MKYCEKKFLKKDEKKFGEKEFFSTFAIPNSTKVVLVKGKKLLILLF